MRYICFGLLRIQDMDYSLITIRLGQQVRQRRLSLGLIQAKLASLTAITRLKVIAVEKRETYR